MVADESAEGGFTDPSAKHDFSFTSNDFKNKCHAFKKKIPSLLMHVQNVKCLQLTGWYLEEKLQSSRLSILLVL